MTEKLENLIEKIEREAIDKAETQSASLLQQARDEAAQIVATSRAEAASLLAEAERQAEQLQENGKKALQQTARDVELSIKESIDDLFSRVLTSEVAGSLEPELMNQLIVKIVKAWEGENHFEVRLSEADAAKLQELTYSSFRSELDSTIALKEDGAVASGFRIGAEGEHFYFDFTAEGIAQVLRAYSSPRLRSILDDGDG